MTTPTDSGTRRIEYVPLDDLVPADRNPRGHNLDAIKTSIRTFGFTAPLLHDERTGRLVAGHGRAEALRQIQADAWDGDGPPDGVRVDGGRWLVPVVRGWASEDDAHADAYLVADNRLTEVGGWDDRMLTELLDDVLDASPDLLAATGYSSDDLDALLASVAGSRSSEPPETLNDPDEVPDAPDQPVSRLGDVWALGPHRLVVGDSTDPAVHHALLKGRQVDCVWTDPPYGINYVDYTPEEAARLNHRRDGKRVANDALVGDALCEFLLGAMRPALAATKLGGCWYVTAPSGEQMIDFGIVLRNLGLLRQTLIWAKDRIAFGRSDYHYRHETIFYGWKNGAAHHAVPDRTQDTVWEIPKPARSEEHPTMKPVLLVARALENSTDEGEVILDFFAGSGTTLIACHDTRRVARLIELDPVYADVIVQRYVNHAGGDPVRESDGMSWSRLRS